MWEHRQTGVSLWLHKDLCGDSRDVEKTIKRQYNNIKLVIIRGLSSVCNIPANLSLGTLLKAQIQQLILLNQSHMGGGGCISSYVFLCNPHPACQAPVAQHLTPYSSM